LVRKTSAPVASPSVALPPLGTPRPTPVSASGPTPRQGSQRVRCYVPLAAPPPPPARTLALALPPLPPSLSLPLGRCSLSLPLLSSSPPILPRIRSGIDDRCSRCCLPHPRPRHGRHCFHAHDPLRHKTSAVSTFKDDTMPAADDRAAPWCGSPRQAERKSDDGGAPAKRRRCKPLLGRFVTSPLSLILPRSDPSAHLLGFGYLGGLDVMDMELFFSSSMYATRWLAGVCPDGALQRKTCINSLNTFEQS
jgi:hypothetical protein